MTVWMIIGALFLLILILLCTPAHVDAFYRNDGLTLQFRYGVIRYTFWPIKETEKPKREKKALRKRRRKPKGLDEEEEATVRGMLENTRLVWSFVKISRKAIQILRRHLIVSRVRIYFVTGGEDAHQIAEQTGTINVLALAVLDVIGVLVVLRKPKVEIVPNFLAPCNRYDLSLRASIRPLFLLAAGAQILIRFLRNPQLKKIPKQQKKGGKAA